MNDPHEVTFSCRVCGGLVIAWFESPLDMDKTCLTCYVTVSDAFIVDQYLENLQRFAEYVDELGR